MPRINTVQKLERTTYLSVVPEFCSKDFEFAVTYLHRDRADIAPTHSWDQNQSGLGCEL